MLVVPFSHCFSKRADKVLVGVVLWNDLAIALADYRRRGSSIININAIPNNGGVGGPRGSASGASLLSCRTSRGLGSRPSVVSGIGSPETAAAAAASTGERFEWEEGSDDEAEAAAMGVSTSGAWWPGLAEVAEAVGKRVGWFPRVRTAEASLLQ